METKMQLQFGSQKKDKELPPDSCTHLGNAATGQSFPAAKPIQKERSNNNFSQHYDTENMHID